ncbi:extracellular solute-binding protein [uncultured Sphaerochaeta sp.]|uniref:extracellular solute-binding protein n=1 Tax=uncultured Sphaerochaeta sp. TaxID=886478 RepID=UPI002A0A21F8|nr:extracellular solute-binding protein [uncultured Sphaerochaeta sp.]
MKRTWNLVLVSLVLLLLLSGCGKSGKEVTTESTASKYVYTGEAPITDIQGQSLSTLAQNSYYTTVDIKKAAIVEKVQKDAGISIDWTLVDPTNYPDAVSPMLASGVDLPDVVLLPDLDQNQTYLSSGMFVPLDTHFSEMPNYKAWLDANPVIKASLTASDGHIYYVPTTNVTHNYQPVLMYNMKWLKDAGLAVPKTLDEFVAVLRYYASHDMNGNGLADEIPMSVRANFLPYMFGPAFGLNFTSDIGSGFFENDKGEVVYAQSTPQYKEYLAFLNGLYKEGLLEVEYTTLTRDQIVARFAQDKTGITFDYGWQQSMTYSPQLPYYDGTLENGVVAQQPLSGPSKGFFVGRNAVGSVFGITSSSSKIDLAAKWLDWATCEKNQEMYVWGIEGESYTVEPDGSKKYTTKASDNTWLQQLGINPAQVLPAHQSVEATNALVAPWHAKQDAYIAQFVKDPWPFIYATEKEAEISAQYMVDIQTYVDEMAVSFVTGVTPLTQYQSYLDALDRMNLPEVLKVRTAQYQRFKSALK